MIIPFDSLAALGEEAERCREERKRDDYEERDWTGETFDEAVAFTRTGDTSRVDEAQRLLDQIESSIDVPQRQWIYDLAGTLPCVPTFLTGDPENMRRVVQAASDTTPLRVFVATSSSADIDKHHLQKRGITILAAVIAVSMVRPIELYTFTTMDGGGRHRRGLTNIMLRIDTAPLCLSEACYALTSVGFDRLLTHTIGRARNKFQGGWAECGQEIDNLRRITGASETDLVVPPSHLDDTQIINDPLAWVNQQIQNYTTETEPT